jgi:sorbitol/mannitol transport system substrate-binding protein
MMHSGHMRKRAAAAALASMTTTALVLAGCSTAGGGQEDGKTSITVAAVANPQIDDLQGLLPEFNKAHPDIEVNISILPETQLKDRVTQDIAAKGGQYDLVMLGPDQTQIWAQNQWLEDLGPYIDDDKDYDAGDIIPAVLDSLSVDGSPYAVPFYAEGAFVMYRADLFEAAGLTMPAQPSWQDIRDFAAALHDPANNVAGICLRGMPTSSGLAMTLNTMIDTFGGSWYDMDWNATLTDPAVKEATEFYLDVQQNYGIPGAVNAGFPECLNAYSQGNAAMWYDATVAASIVETPATSKVVGKNGYALSPVEKTDAGSWFWAWSFAMPATSEKKDAAATFLKWATSKEYIQLVGETLSWTQVPPGSRTSTYEIPEYMEAVASFGPQTLEALSTLNIIDPGVSPRPYVGGGWLALPEGQDIATKFAQEVSAALVGSATVDEALEKANTMANQAAKDAGRQK